MKEFRPIPIAEKYLISRDGEIKNTENGRVIKQTPTTSGHLKVSLVIDGKRYFFMVHRLVAMTYLDNPNRFSIVNHKDGNKQNNQVRNLEWASPSYNNYHAGMNNLAYGNVRIDNTVGATGIAKRKNGIFIPYINSAGKRYYGGSYRNIEDAIEKRKDMKTDLQKRFFGVRADDLIYAVKPFVRYGKRLNKTIMGIDDTMEHIDDAQEKYDDLMGKDNSKRQKKSVKNIIKQNAIKQIKDTKQYEGLDALKSHIPIIRHIELDDIADNI